MPAASTPQIRAAVVARALAAVRAADFDKVSVTYGHPGNEWATFSWISILPGQSPIRITPKRSPDRVSADGGSRDTDQELTLAFWVPAPGQYGETDLQACVELVWALFDVVNADLRTPAGTTLDDLVTFAYVDQVEDNDYFLTEGRGAELLARLQIEQRRT